MWLIYARQYIQISPFIVYSQYLKDKGMAKKRCEKKDYEKPEEAKYECKKCGRQAVKEKQVCKPKEV